MNCIFYCTVYCLFQKLLSSLKKSSEQKAIVFLVRTWLLRTQLSVMHHHYRKTRPGFSIAVVDYNLTAWWKVFMHVYLKKTFLWPGHCAHSKLSCCYWCSRLWGMSGSINVGFRKRWSFCMFLRFFDWIGLVNNNTNHNCWKYGCQKKHFITLKSFRCLFSGTAQW